MPLGTQPISSRAPQAWVQATQFGVKADGATDDATALQAAVNAVKNTGDGWGTVQLPTGHILLNNTVVIPTGVRLQGAGQYATRLLKGADVILLDVSGQHPGLTTTSDVKNTGFADLSLWGLGDGVGTASLMRAYYSNQMNLDRVGFYYTGGMAFDAVELWDTAFTQCQFEVCGSTTLPAVQLAGSSGAVTGFGHSTDLCNNVYFNRCRWEECYSAVWSFGDPHPNELIRFNHCKFETSRAAASQVQLWYCDFSTFTDSYFQVSNISGAAKQICLELNLANLTTVKGLFARSSTGHQAISSVIQIQDSNNVSIRDIGCETDSAASKPSVALVTYVGTNRRHLRSNVQYAYWNEVGWAPTQYSGAPTDVVT